MSAHGDGLGVTTTGKGWGLSVGNQERLWTHSRSGWWSPWTSCQCPDPGSCPLHCAPGSPPPPLPSGSLLRPPSCPAEGDTGVCPGRRGGYQAGCGQCWHEAEGQLSQQLAYLGVEEGNGAQCGKGSTDPCSLTFALSFPQLSLQSGAQISWVVWPPGSAAAPSSDPICPLHYPYLP